MEPTEIARVLAEHTGFEAVKHSAVLMYEKIHAFTSSAKMDKAIVELARELEDRKVGSDALVKAFKREQFEPLFSRLLIESVYAATEERRRHLRAVLVGLVKFDDGAELQSRIVRAVMILEPSDVKVLRSWSADAEPRLEDDTQVRAHSVSNTFGEEFSIAALESALCLVHNFNGRAVTALGRAVLRYIEGP